MIIKNTTKFSKESMEGAMRASNFDNTKYKNFKLFYNLFGLIFGMVFVRALVFNLTGNKESDIFMTVFYAVACGAFLYIGMIGMDKSNKKKFHNIYGKMIGITFRYEIDAENIVVTDEEEDSDTMSWDEVTKWKQDANNIYLFVGEDNCLVVDKSGFSEGTEEDLRQLAGAVLGLRAEESQNNEVDSDKKDEKTAQDGDSSN